MTPPPARRFPLLVLAYLGPLALVPLVAARHDADVQWHARQGLMLLLMELVVFGALLAATGLTILSSLAGGFVVASVTWLLWVATLLLHLAGIVLALNGERLRVPLVSRLASWSMAASRSVGSA